MSIADIPLGPDRPSDQGGDGDFVRGAKVAFGQLKPLAMATIGLAGDISQRLFGVGEGVRDWGYSGYVDGMEKLKPLSRETDDVTVAWKRATEEGDYGALVDWAQYAFGYGLAQLGQSAVTALAGGGAGLLAGGAIRSTVAKTMSGAVSKIATGLVEKGVAPEIAKQQAVKAITARIGKGVALGTMAQVQELGTTYGEAREEKGGEELTGGELARAGAAGFVAGLLETGSDVVSLGLVTGKFPWLGKTAPRRAAAGGLLGGTVEGGTEIAQTAIERFGAGKPVADEAGVNEMINAGAMGALPGVVASGAGGAFTRPPSPQRSTPPTPGVNPVPEADEIIGLIGQARTIEEAAQAAGILAQKSPLDQFLQGEEERYQGILAGAEKAVRSEGFDQAAALAPAVPIAPADPFTARQAEVAAAEEAARGQGLAQMARDQGAAQADAALAAPAVEPTSEPTTMELAFRNALLKQDEKRRQSEDRIWKATEESKRKAGFEEADAADRPPAVPETAFSDRQKAIAKEEEAAREEGARRMTREQGAAQADLAEAAAKGEGPKGPTSVGSALAAAVEQQAGRMRTGLRGLTTAQLNLIAENHADAAVQHEARLLAEARRNGQTGEDATQAQKSPQRAAIAAQLASREGVELSPAQAEYVAAYSTEPTPAVPARAATPEHAEVATELARSGLQHLSGAALSFVAESHPDRAVRLRAADWAVLRNTTGLNATPTPAAAKAEARIPADYKPTDWSGIKLESLVGGDGTTPAGDAARLAKQKQAERRAPPGSPPLVRLQATVSDTPAALVEVKPDALPEKRAAANNGIPNSTTLSKDEFDTIRTLAAIFKKKVLLFRDTRPGTHTFDGAVLGGDNQYIYLNADASGAHHLVVVGHELVHIMRREAPELYERMRSFLLESETNANAFYRYYMNEPKATDEEIAEALKDPKLRDRLLEEFIADLIGNRFGEYRTWDMLAQHAKAKGDSSLLLRVAQFVLKFLRDIFSKSRFDKFTTDQWVKDLRGVQQRARSIIRDYAKQTQAAPAAQAASSTGELVQSMRREIPPDQVESRVEVSTTQPIAKKSSNNPLTQEWVIDTEDIRAGAEQFNQLIRAIREMPGIPQSSNPEEQLRLFTQRVKENLLWLHDLVPAELRARAKLWYDGANRIANTWSNKFGYSVRQVSGVLAALSPQMDWFKNVSLGERVLTIVRNQADTAWNADMSAWARSWAEAADTVEDMRKRRVHLARMLRLEGKRLNEMSDRDAAYFVRAYDETYHDRAYRIVTPEGNFVDFAVTSEEGDAAVTWGGFGPIIKAVSMLRDGSFENVSRSLGNEHKVRNFFNNIVNPNSTEGHVTIDTHAVGAALLLSVSGNATEVKQSFGTSVTEAGRTSVGSNRKTGASGAYGAFADAYRQAAAERGILPREMQSITWEAIRALFEAKAKKGISSEIRRLWQKAQDAAVTREEIKARAGGLSPFSWVGMTGESAETRSSFNRNEGPRVLPRGKQKDAATLNLSVVGNKFPDIARLADLAGRGNLLAAEELNVLANDWLRRRFKGLARMKLFPVRGLYGAVPEVSLVAELSFSEYDRDNVVRALSDFGIVFGQSEVHMRQLALKGTEPGHVYHDGSYATLGVRIELKKAIPDKKLQRLYKTAGLAGVTSGDDFVEVYHVSQGSGNENAEIKAFERVVERFVGLLGGDAGKVEQSLWRLWSYGDGDGARIGYVHGEFREAEGLQRSATRLAEPAGRSGDVGLRDARPYRARPRQADGQTVVGVHYGRAKVPALSDRYYGRGIKGAEAGRLAQARDSRLRNRVYFYLQTSDQLPTPEQGLGPHVYRQTFDNVLMPGDTMRALRRANPDANAFESAVIDAGYDGYAVPDLGMMVLLDVGSVPAGYLGTRENVAPVAPMPQAARQSYALLSRELAEFARNEETIRAEAPSVDLRNGSLRFDEADRPALRRFFPEMRASTQRLIADFEQSPAFRAWKGDAPLVSDEDSRVGAAFTSGKPVVVKGYHGTTRDFSRFDRKKLDPGSYFGAGIYVTNTPDDASYNYASVNGPDVDLRIQTLADQIAQRLADEESRLTWNDIREKAKKEAKAYFMDHEGAVLPLYVRLNNPAVFGGDGETSFTDLDQLADAIFSTGASFGDTNPRVVVSDVIEAFIDEKSISAEKLLDIFVNSPGSTYASDNEGRSASREWFRRVLEKLGYDGVIDQRVKRRFVGMGNLAPGTKHFVAFRENAVKSIFNESPSEDPDIMLSPAWHGGRNFEGRFSTEHIGRGEGAQAYGWGLYFTDVRGIARDYQKALARKLGEESNAVVIVPDGVPSDAVRGLIKDVLDKHPDTVAEARSIIKKLVDEKKRAAQLAERSVEYTEKSLAFFSDEKGFDKMLSFLADAYRSSDSYEALLEARANESLGFATEAVVDNFGDLNTRTIRSIVRMNEGGPFDASEEAEIKEARAWLLREFHRIRDSLEHDLLLLNKDLYNAKKLLAEVRAEDLRAWKIYERKILSLERPPNDPVVKEFVDTVINEVDKVDPLGSYPRVFKEIQDAYQEASALDDVSPAERNRAKARYEAVRDLKPEDFPVALVKPKKEKKTALYKVNIEDDVISRMVLWDRPYAEQPESVKEALDNIILPPHTSSRGVARVLGGIDRFKQGEIDWPSLHRGVLETEATPRGASAALFDAGITGVKYLTGSDRRKGEGRYNYVVFNEDHVELLERFSKQRAWGEVNDAQKAALEHVFGPEPAPTSVFERMRGVRTWLKQNVIQGVFDQFDAIRQLDYKAYVLARNSKMGDQVLEGTMIVGKPVLGDDGGVTADTSEGGFANILANTIGYDDYQRFFAWVASQRAERLSSIGLENLFSPDHIRAMKTLDQPDAAHPDRTARFAEGLRKLGEWNEAVLQVGVKSGYLDPTAVEIMREQIYVPFYRILEDREGNVRFPTVGRSLVGQQALKRLKGGTQTLNPNMLENVLRNWSNILNASLRNQAARETMTAAVPLGVAEVVPSGVKGSVSFWDGGKQISVMVHEPHLLAALQGLAPTKPGWMRPISRVKHWLTFGVTTNPAFKIRNLLRDSLQAAASTNQMDPNPIKNVAIGWLDSNPESEAYKQALIGGGVIKFGPGFEGERGDQIIRDSVLTGRKLGGLLGMANHLWEAYNKVGDRSENVNRLALRRELQGRINPETGRAYTVAEINFMTRDLMDFTLQGGWAPVRFLAESVPFFNARLQGLYRLGRSNPGRLGAYAFGVMGASLALLLMHQDDPDWKKREDWDRDTYWWFKIGNKAFRIPKPFELGAIGTLAERTWEYFTDKEMTTRRYTGRIADIFSQQLSMSIVPQIVAPIFEIDSNKDAFTGRPIEGIGIQRLTPQDRYTERTAAVSRLVGMLGLPQPAELMRGRYAPLSPVQVEHLLHGYFGWVGSSILTAVDWGLRPMITEAPRPAMRLRDVFLAGNFVESLPAGSSRYVSQFYETAKQVEQVYASLQDAKKLGRTDRVKEILAEEGDLLRRKPQIQNVTTQLQRLSLNARRIEASRLSPEEKRRALDQIEARRGELTRSVEAR